MEKIRWSPKVRPMLIERVYRQDATGVRDEALIDELGIGLLLRCESVLRAMRWDVECPRCRREFNVEARASESPDGIAACPGECGWQTTRQAVRDSRRNRDLNGADSIVPIFSAFAGTYPTCRTAADKMLCIDRLIHEFHWDGKLDLPGRSVANNLIEGSHKQVIAFLDGLSAIDPQRKERWRATVETMWQWRRGQLKPPAQDSGDA